MAWAVRCHTSNTIFHAAVNVYLSFRPQSAVPRLYLCVWVLEHGTSGQLWSSTFWSEGRWTRGEKKKEREIRKREGDFSWLFKFFLLLLFSCTRQGNGTIKCLIKNRRICRWRFKPKHPNWVSAGFWLGGPDSGCALWVRDLPEE